MLARLGFVASVLTRNLSTSRTCRLRNATEDRLRELIGENLAALEPSARIGARLRVRGVRVSTHPGQYTVLNSPHGSIVSAAVSELAYHARLLDALGADTTCKVVVHIGGLYGASERLAMDRFVARASQTARRAVRARNRRGRSRKRPCRRSRGIAVASPQTTFRL